MVATSCKETPNTTAPKEEVETATSEKTETMETTEAACLGRFAHKQPYVVQGMEIFLFAVFHIGFVGRKPQGLGTFLIPVLIEFL